MSMRKPENKRNHCCNEDIIHSEIFIYNVYIKVINGDMDELAVVLDTR